jgi:hypothetical protein
MYVVEHHRHAVAWSLGKADIPRNYAFKYLGPEEASEIGRHLLRKGCAVIVHRQKNPFDRKGWIDRAAKARERVEKFRDALERQELALNRHKDRVACGQRVHGEDIERWWAINDNELVFLAERLDHLPQAIFSIFHRDQLDRGADKVLIRWDQVEAVNLSVSRHAFDGLAEYQGLVQRAASGIFGKAQRAGGVSLRIGVDDEGVLFGSGE